MKYFCTLSDINFLAKGIALYQSLKAHSKEEFKLYYLSLDENTYNKLSLLNFEEIIPINLKNLEKEKDLQIAGTNRPYNEYCWTLSSYLCYHLLLNEPVDHITYIDSDIYFYADPDIIYKEINEKSVGIIKHRHNSVGSDNDGAYNVGVIYFKNNDKGKEILLWWRDAVLYKKYPELQTCGDQKYLEKFEVLYGSENICIADKTFGHGAPWNYRLYGYGVLDQEGKIIWGDKKQFFVFNHFSRLSYNLETNEVLPTSGQYKDHTLNFQVFGIPQVMKLYQDYYAILKNIHQTLLNPKTPHIQKKKLKIAVGMILFESDYVLKQCLESIYPFASQIMVAEGPVKYWQEQGRTTSTDKSNEILENFPDPDNKIKITHGQFNEKDDQCKAYMPFLKDNTDYIWNIDSDELYKSEDIEKLIQILSDNKYTSVGIRPLSFYGSFDRYITGWEEKVDQFLRIFKVYPGSTWECHRPPKIKHQPGIPFQPKHINSEELYKEHGIRMYHYSYVFPRQVHEKIAYYKAAVSKHKCIDDYFKKVYLPWVTGDEITKRIIEEGYDGVHEWKSEYRSETYTEIYKGEHPVTIQNSMNELIKEFNKQLGEFQKK